MGYGILASRMAKAAHIIHGDASLDAGRNGTQSPESSMRMDMCIDMRMDMCMDMRMDIRCPALRS